MGKTKRILSDNGQGRRQEILELAIAEARRLRKWRARTRVTGSCSILLLAIVAGTYFTARDDRPLDPRVADRTQVTSSSSGAPETVGGDGAAQVSSFDLADYLVSGDVDIREVYLLPKHTSIDLADYLVRSDIEEWTAYLTPKQGEIPGDILLDDQQLVVTLAALGKVDTLVRTENRIWLMKQGRLVREQALMVD